MRAANDWEEAPMGRGLRRLENADIAFAATVRAKQLRFAELPHTSIEFTGTPEHVSDSGSNRVHLPQRVERDVTYRHIRVDYWLASALLYPSEARHQD